MGQIKNIKLHIVTDIKANMTEASSSRAKLAFKVANWQKTFTTDESPSKTRNLTQEQVDEAEEQQKLRAKRKQKWKELQRKQQQEMTNKKECIDLTTENIK